MQKDYEPLIDAVRRTPHAGFQFEGNRLIQHPFHLLQTNTINIGVVSDNTTPRAVTATVLNCELINNYQRATRVASAMEIDFRSINAEGNQSRAPPAGGS